MQGLSDKQRTMLDALRGCGSGWHDRKELAAALGKLQINPAEMVILDLLAEQGLIEKRFAPGTQEHINRWVYRISA